MINKFQKFRASAGQGKTDGCGYACRGESFLYGQGKCRRTDDADIRHFIHRYFRKAVLVEVTRRMFRLSDKREDTYIAGLSMGSYGAYMNGLKYSDTFSHAACLSMAMMDKKASWKGILPMDAPEFVRAVFGTGDMDENLKSQRVMTEYCLKKGIRFPELWPPHGEKITIGDSGNVFQD